MYICPHGRSGALVIGKSSESHAWCNTVICVVQVVEPAGPRHMAVGSVHDACSGRRLSWCCTVHSNLCMVPKMLLRVLSLSGRLFPVAHRWCSDITPAIFHAGYPVGPLRKLDEKVCDMELTVRMHFMHALQLGLLLGSNYHDSQTSQTILSVPWVIRCASIALCPCNALACPLTLFKCEHYIPRALVYGSWLTHLYQVPCLPHGYAVTVPYTSTRTAIAVASTREWHTASH